MRFNKQLGHKDLYKQVVIGEETNSLIVTGNCCVVIAYENSVVVAGNHCRVSVGANSVATVGLWSIVRGEPGAQIFREYAMGSGQRGILQGVIGETLDCEMEPLEAGIWYAPVFQHGEWQWSRAMWFDPMVRDL